MERTEGRKIYTVSELSREIRAVLEDTYPEIWLEGEVSGLKKYASGHTYFSLKDAESQISAVLFQGMGRFIKFELEEGMSVIVRGRVTVYPKRGGYQILVNYAEPKGVGALQLAFEQLKDRLSREGLFDEARKRKLPMLPQKIGVVTSPDGAALKDILTVLDRRYPNVEVLIYPVRVQGDEAKYEIKEAIEYLNEKYPGLDVLLVGRGGGSYQDLWAFNEEMVARAIYASKIPVVSCVGHEVDFTIADFTADLRAPTPSAAAEMAVRDKLELERRLETSKIRLNTAIENTIEAMSRKLNGLSESKVLVRPQAVFELKAQRLDELSGDLERIVGHMLNNKTEGFTHAAQKLNLVSPLNVLARGYSICENADSGKVIKDAYGAKPGDNIKVTLRKGILKAVVSEVLQ